MKFCDCSQIFMFDEFGLKQIKSLPSMIYWKEIFRKEIIEKKEKIVLKCLQKVIGPNLRIWREIDWMQYNVGPILTLANFRTDYFNIFSWRRIEANVDGWHLFGEPDAIIASNPYEPRIPYLCLNEYKRSEETKGDSIGQVLAAMLVSQKLNDNKRPIYGIFLIGVNWHFIVLEGKEYCISGGFSVDSENGDIFRLFRMLKALKNILLEYFV